MKQVCDWRQSSGVLWLHAWFFLQLLLCSNTPSIDENVGSLSIETRDWSFYIQKNKAKQIQMKHTVNPKPSTHVLENGFGKYAFRIIKVENLQRDHV